MTPADLTMFRARIAAADPDDLDLRALGLHKACVALLAEVDRLTPAPKLESPTLGLLPHVPEPEAFLFFAPPPTINLENRPMTPVEQRLLALEAEAQRLKRAAQRIAEIPGHIADLEDQRLLISNQIKDLAEELAEHQRTISMLFDEPPAPTPLAAPERSGKRTGDALDRVKANTFRKTYGEDTYAAVCGIVAQGGEVDDKIVRRLVGDEPDANGKWPMNNLIHPVLRVLGCTEVRHQWFAPLPKPK
jgi:hypothetical protein